MSKTTCFYCSGVLFMAKKFYKKDNMGTLSRLAVGTLICACSIVIISTVFGAVATSLEDTTAKIPLFAMLTLILSAILSGGVVSRTVADGRVIFSMLIALLTSLIFILIGIIVGGGAVSGAVFLNFLIFVGVFTLAAYLFRKREKHFGKGFKV